MHRPRLCERPVLAGLLAVAASSAAGADGPPLKVGVYELPGIVSLEAGRPSGVAVDFWREIADRLGLESTFIVEKDIATLMADTAAGRIDVLLGPLAVTEAREKEIDFTHPLLTSGMRIAVPGREARSWFAPLASVFSRELLAVALAILGLVVVTAHVLWFVERFRNDRAFPRGYREGIREAIWWSISTVMTGGCDNKSIETTAGRVVAIVWILGGIAAIATLTCTIAAKLTAEQVTGSIHGPRDLAGRMVGVMESAVSAQAVRARGGSVLSYPRLQDALDAARRGEVDAVVHENHIMQALLAVPENASFRLVGPIFDTYDFAMGVPPGSPLRETLATAILAAREDGSLKRIIERSFGREE
ncbi:MAG: transporter substrate-binding domain-containing protein [Planctomycetota bacterium]